MPAVVAPVRERTPYAVLPATDWSQREAAHEARVDRLLAGHRERAARGEAHPVEDFLFTYYRLRPARLRQWHPGALVALEGAERDGYVSVEGGVRVDVEAALSRHGERIARTAAILRATAHRPASFGCFGMHEWAMVYRLGHDAYRHATWPLRLTPAEVDTAVERRPLVCTHFDAFRFFTPAAVPRNAAVLSRDGQAATEQPGCLHANMDLYRAAYTLLPLVPSELVADCFELAREIRYVDMAATPYDLTALGVRPIAVETAAGRAEYVAHQQRLAGRAAPLRAALVHVLDRLEVGG